jgi:hypothetical protein
VKLSDSPYAVGTPEHGDWVRHTFIPTVSAERTAHDRALYGAEAQGRKIVHGFWLDFNCDGFRQAIGNLSKTLDEMVPLLAGLSFAFERITEPDRIRPIIARQRQRRRK